MIITNENVKTVSTRILENRMTSLEDQQYELEDKQGTVQDKIEEAEAAGKSIATLNDRFETVSNKLEKIEDEHTLICEELDERAKN